jgi:predicted dehydrogenase
MERPRVGLGIIGAGFAARFHVESARRARGVEVDIVGVASRTEERVRRFAEEHGIPFWTTEVERLLEREDVDVVSLCVPVHAHAPLALQVAAAGKHIICEKPLTGYCGEDRPEEEPVGRTVPKREMFARAMAMVEAAHRHGVLLMYAENWVYAPAVAKARRLLRTAKGTILDIRGEESHSGSHSPYSLRWRTSGGGALLRLGSHPIGAALHLKRYEGMLREGRPIVPVAVTAEVANLAAIPAFQREERHWVVTGWEDVENWASCLITFADGSRATILATDVSLGGVRNEMEILLSNARIQCHLNPNNLCVAYAPDPGIFAEEYLAEKLETKAGWSFPSVDEDYMHGYPHEMEDFLQAVAWGREPLSDGELGREVVRVIYAAYQAAEEGRRIDLR